MTAAELARQIRESRTVGREAFEERVTEEAAWLKEQLREGTFDKPQAIVGFRTAAAQEECHTEGIHLVSDGFWTIPPSGPPGLCCRPKEITSLLQLEVR